MVSIFGFCASKKLSPCTSLIADVDEVSAALLMLICPRLRKPASSVPENTVYLVKALEHLTVTRPKESRMKMVQNMESIFNACSCEMSLVRILNSWYRSLLFFCVGSLRQVDSSQTRIDFC